MNKQTERLFYNYISPNPTAAEILEVIALDDGKVNLVLDKTIFYPEGGGQPSDLGSINGIPLLAVTDKQGIILHTVSLHRLVPGPCELILDVRRRRDFSQQHTGQHLLSSLILAKIGAATVSMHLGDEHCTIDIDTPHIESDALLAIEEEAADIIEENLPIITHLCPPEDLNSFNLRKPPPPANDGSASSDDTDSEIIRVVEIPGRKKDDLPIDLIACCGTHVSSTSEIGLLRIYSAEKYKGKTRVYFNAGRRLLSENRRLYENALLLSKNLSVPINDIGSGFRDYLEKAAFKETRLKTLEEKMTGIKARELSGLIRDSFPETKAERKVFVKTYEEEGMDEVMSIGKLVLKEMSSSGQGVPGQPHPLPPAAIVLASLPDLKIAAFSSGKDLDIKTLLKDPFEKWGAKGGGSPAFFQGSFTSAESLQEFVNSVHKNDI